MSGDLVDPAQHLAGLEPPDGAGGVDAAGPDEVGVHLVPVERREGGAEVRVLVVVEHALKQRV